MECPNFDRGKVQRFRTCRANHDAQSDRSQIERDRWDRESSAGRKIAVAKAMWVGHSCPTWSGKTFSAENRLCPDRNVRLPCHRRILLYMPSELIPCVSFPTCCIVS